MTRAILYAVIAALFAILLMSAHRIGYYTALDCVREGEGSDVASSPVAVADVCAE